MQSCWSTQVSDLASAVRHDLRDPLGAIAHWVQLLETPGLDDVVHARALQGIRNALGEQVTQIGQLSDLLEQLKPQCPDDPASAGGSPTWTPVDLHEVLNQVGANVSVSSRNRLQRIDAWPEGDPSSSARVIRADEPALIQALASLVTLGLRQLLEHEQLLLGVQSQAPQGAGRIMLRVQGAVTGEPIDQPWRILSDPGAAMSLALMHTRSILSRHRADLHIVTTGTTDDTLLLDFPLFEAGRDEG